MDLLLIMVKNKTDHTTVTMIKVITDLELLLFIYFFRSDDIKIAVLILDNYQTCELALAGVALT